VKFQEYLVAKLRSGIKIKYILLNAAQCRFITSVTLPVQSLQHSPSQYQSASAACLAESQCSHAQPVTGLRHKVVSLTISACASRDPSRSIPFHGSDMDSVRKAVSPRALLHRHGPHAAISEQGLCLSPSAALCASGRDRPARQTAVALHPSCRQTLDVAAGHARNDPRSGRAPLAWQSPEIMHRPRIGVTRPCLCSSTELTTRCPIPD
jgi:hypothetical protein